MVEVAAGGTKHDPVSSRRPGRPRRRPHRRRLLEQDGEKKCNKLRSEAFDLLNKGQQCNNDQDCRQSDWPGCAKPVSIASWDKIKPMADSYKKGQCEEPAGVQGAAPSYASRASACTARRAPPRARARARRSDEIK